MQGMTEANTYMTVVESNNMCAGQSLETVGSVSSVCEGVCRLKKTWCLPNSNFIVWRRVKTDSLHTCRCRNWVTKDLVASTRAMYPHHWSAGDVLGRAPCALRKRLPTLQPSSQDWRADINRTHAELYLSWSKDSLSNQHRHSSMHVDDVAVATARACTMYACAYIKFSVEAWKKFAVGRVSWNRDFFGVALM